MDIVKKVFVYLSDIQDLTFRVRFINSRQDFGEESKEYYQAFTGGRTDMYWIEVFYGDKDLCCIAVDNLAGCPVCDPCRFGLNVQNAEVESEGDCFIKAVRAWFMAQPEYRQQIEWVKYLDTFIKTVRNQQQWIHGYSYDLSIYDKFSEKSDDRVPY